MFGEGVSLEKIEREETELGRGNLYMEMEIWHLKKEREEKAEQGDHRIQLRPGTWAARGMRSPGMMIKPSDRVPGGWRELWGQELKIASPMMPSIHPSGRKG